MNQITVTLESCLQEIVKHVSYFSKYKTGEANFHRIKVLTAVREIETMLSKGVDTMQVNVITAWGGGLGKAVDTVREEEKLDNI